jgi:aspartyl-tRNA(Asn)/glutamyl-tRNA(Gln) amidotransferase subunit A
MTMVATALELSYLTIAEAGDLFRRRELSPVDLTLAQLDRIERLQPALRAFLTVTSDVALREARAAEAALLRGDDRPLLGIPVGYKDIYMTAGVRTTGASMLYENYVPDVDATTITRLHDAGVVMLGKLHTHEFASGITPEDHPLPPARNPWNTERIPGGSSSGSGAALAAGLVIGALGTDTGGSIRGPGSFCGIAALKPTYGRCSRYGVYTLSWSLDHTGPMARTVEDVALMLNALAAYDPKDPASANVPAEDYTLSLGRSIKGMRVGVLRSWYTPTADEAVAETVEAALVTLKELGAEVVDVEIPHIGYTAVSSAIMMPEAYAYHQADLMETPEKYAPQLRARLLSGGLFLAHEYVNAQRARQILRQEVAETLRGVDVLVSPTSAQLAPTFEESYTSAMRRRQSYTGLYNMTGLPAISVNCGFVDGLPVGLQVAGRPFAESTVLQVAHAYERAAGWYTRHPAL